MFKVILYYYYLEIKDVDKLLKQHLNFFEGLDIKGRIIISQEGINGTLSGLEEDVDNYMNFVKEDLGLEKINFKIDRAYAFHANGKLASSPFGGLNG